MVILTVKINKINMKKPQGSMLSKLLVLPLYQKFSCFHFVFDIYKIIFCFSWVDVRHNNKNNTDLPQAKDFGSLIVLCDASKSLLKLFFNYLLAQALCQLWEHLGPGRLGVTSPGQPVSSGENSVLVSAASSLWPGRGQRQKKFSSVAT